MTFTIYEQEQIDSLPSEVLELCRPFPTITVNLGEVWSEPELRDPPRFIEVYFGESQPAIIFLDGDGKKFIPRDADAPFVAIYGDDELIFLEVGGQQILDRLGNIKLPLEFSDPLALVQNSTVEVCNV